MSIPKKVKVIEVGSRDGFQMETNFIPTEQKIEIINGLIAAGLRHFELTSFVSPKAIPQLRDAAEVLAGIDRVPGLYITVLVPNPKGALNAVQSDIDALVVFLSATESHNMANVNRSVGQSMESFKEVAEIAARAGKDLRAAIATCFGCPFEGEVTPEQVGDIVQPLMDLGVKGFCLGDTTGMATPPVVRRTCGYLMKRFPEAEFSLHFHNTRGIGLVNAYEGLLMGMDTFESSVAGLGGCPFAPGASGNITTEDLVYMLDEMGLNSGVDLNALIKTARRTEEIIGRTLPGQVMKAGPRMALHQMPHCKEQIRLAAPPQDAKR